MKMKDELDGAVQQIKEIAANGRVSEALERIDLLIGEYPEAQLASYTRAQLYAQYLPPKVSLREVASQCTKFPRDRSGTVLSASIHLHKGNPKEALRLLEKAESAVGLTRFGSSLKVATLAALGRLDEARALSTTDDLERATRAEEVWDYATLHEPANDKEMLAVASRARELGEQPEWAELYVAKWYWNHGQRDKAEASLTDSLSRFPSDPELNHYMARLDLALGRTDAAFARINDIVARNPSDVQATSWILLYYLRRLQIRNFFRTVNRFGAAMRRLRSKPRND